MHAHIGKVAGSILAKRKDTFLFLRKSYYSLNVHHILPEMSTKLLCVFLQFFCNAQYWQSFLNLILQGDLEKAVT